MRVVADTHALVWFLEADDRLSARAREVLEQAQRDHDSGIVVSLASRLDLHETEQTDWLYHWWETIDDWINTTRQQESKKV